MGLAPGPRSLDQGLRTKDPGLPLLIILRLQILPLLNPVPLNRLQNLLIHRMPRLLLEPRQRGHQIPELREPHPIRINLRMPVRQHLPDHPHLQPSKCLPTTSHNQSPFSCFRLSLSPFASRPCFSAVFPSPHSDSSSAPGSSPARSPGSRTGTPAGCSAAAPAPPPPDPPPPPSPRQGSPSPTRCTHGTSSMRKPRRTRARC